MKRAQATDDEIMTQVKELFASNTPPIPLNVIESSDPTVGHGIVALVDIVRDGKAVLGTKTMKFFQWQPVLTQALQALAGRGSPPPFNFQTLLRGDRLEILKLLRWILSFRKSAPVVPRIAWLQRMGIHPDRSAPITADTIAAVAKRFGLAGEPFAAFRRAGVPLPDNPPDALTAIFQAAERLQPGEIHFAHDPPCEAELLRLEGIARSAPTERAVIEKALAALPALSKRCQGRRVTQALATRTNSALQEAGALLEAALRRIDQRERHERERQAKAARQAAAAFELKAVAAQDRIEHLALLAVQRVPDTIGGIEKRIQALEMAGVAESLSAAESDENAAQERIATLHAQFADVSSRVRQRKQELVDHMQGIQSEKRAQHAALRELVTSALAKVEGTIDDRTENSGSRCRTLRTQLKLLRDAEFEACQDGAALDQVLRDHKVLDFQPIVALKSEIARLRERLDLAIREADEIERRRKAFRSAVADAMDKFRSIERNIGNFAFRPLRQARTEKDSVATSRQDITNEVQKVDESWATLIEMRVFPRDPLDELHTSKDQVLQLCDENFLRLEAAILRLEEETIAKCMSAFEAFEIEYSEAESRYQALPVDPRERLPPLRKFCSPLLLHLWRVESDFRELAKDGLCSRINPSVLQRLSTMSQSIYRYYTEEMRLKGYIEPIDHFHRTVGRIRYEIEDLRKHADRALHAATREGNLSTYHLFVQLAMSAMRQLWTVCSPAYYATQAQGLDANEFLSIVTQIRDAFNLELRNGVRILNERTPPPRGVLPTPASIVGFRAEALVTRPDIVNQRLRLEIDRSNALDDFIAFAVVHSGVYFGEGLCVRFKGEPGIDHGGLARELITMISDPLLKRALVASNRCDSLWFPQNADCDATRIDALIATGFLIRIAIEMEQSLTDLLNLSFFKALQDLPMTLIDLREMCPETAAGLDLARGNYEKGEDDGLFFQDGREVTRVLFEQYVEEVISLVMGKCVSVALDAVKRGFHGRSPWASVFFVTDLHNRVTGPRIVDWMDLKRSCQLVGYSPGDVSVKLFWEVFLELKEGEKRKVLWFITGSDRPHALGLGSRPISLKRVEWNNETKSPPPESHTCFNSLVLPSVTARDTMRQILQICIDHHTGFGIA